MPNALSTVAHPPARPPRARRDWRNIRLLIPGIVLLVIFFMLPVLSLLLRSVLEPTPGLHNYEQLLGSSTYLRVFGNTFLVATVVTVVTVAIGFPTAWLLAIAPRKLSSLLFSILLLSMWTNLLARTFAWMVLLQATGPINRLLMATGLISEPLALVNNLVGVTIGMTYIMLPFLVMPLHATLRSIDPSTLRAAAVCGASRWQAFWRILVPLAMPGIASGALMVFVMALGYFVTPALLGGAQYMMLAELVAQLVQELLNWGLAGAAAFVLLAVTLSLYALQLRFTGGARANGGL
ncbi:MULTISPECIES: ABC transporter permease [Paraburkholderia]|jgi:putative spermidine/putrescine transport system permease protein|uniref:Spermidine/putrescine transport system permease protein n=1 Tax=Paraburkholderia tropica TaxID=92647 RepID=A0ABX5MV32_9BURK|nr:ABC transporter permease [Paraburkholderia tropica]MBB3000325.1 putative spermidine/putrescine transport system permease protein [Paraburkholderia tropica]MBB6319955.1 putative spermidine/putrescine transport system permease protein [Paraburkholderia tropica]MDE1144578.1 ABC transporter permease [Paraburkholderia tropica]PXX17468.1 putative spermidine/putrescine transport system permease protein [Paraburkholderia tropica]PZW84650.1 putative spermidine/putrescine transport system permease pr